MTITASPCSCGVVYPATNLTGSPTTTFPIVAGEYAFASLADVYSAFPRVAWSWDSANSSLVAVGTGSTLPDFYPLVTSVSGWELEDTTDNWLLEDGAGVLALGWP